MLINRYYNNPILIKSHVPFTMTSVRKATVFKQDGAHILIFSLHKPIGLNILGKAVSNDGYPSNVDTKLFLN